MSFRGVDEHYGKIRIRFMHKGKREAIHLDLPYAPASMRKAFRMREAILSEIKAGVYDERKYFPDRATRGGELFRDLADEWLLNIERAGTKKATRVKYKQLLDDIWLPIFGDKHMRQLSTHETRKLVLAAREWNKLSVVRWNDALIPLRAIVSLGVEKELCNRELISWAKNKKRPPAKPAALSAEDAKTLLTWTEANLPEQAHNAIEFLLHTGIRPGELIALKWSAIDLKAGLLWVRETKNLHEESAPKDGEERLITLSSRAIECLRRQRQVVQLTSDYVFLHPVLMQPYSEIRPLRERYWDKAFAATGIPYRRLKDTRSTYATRLIRSGVPMNTVSEQLGHSSVTITEKHYKAEFDATQAAARRKLLDAALGK